MRAVVQRVKNGKVIVNGEIVSEIGAGVVVLLGISSDDDYSDCDYLIKKIVNLRIFPDENGKMNLSIKDLNYSVLIISQFTLYGDCKKGNRPNFMEAAPAEKADMLYSYFVENMTKEVDTKTGIFRAMMKITIEMDGPVTILLDSKKAF